MARPKKLAEVLTNNKPGAIIPYVPYKDYMIIEEPHEQGTRVVLATNFGTYITEERGEREACIAKIKELADKRVIPHVE